jgi:hypothetical protein
MLMLTALSIAGLAYISAEAADLHGKSHRMLIRPGHEGGRGAAYIGAVHIQLNALMHHFHIVFTQACRGTVVTGSGTGIACIDTTFEFFVAHRINV